MTHFDGGAFTLDSREVLATNGLIEAEMVHLFMEMFAGREMEPIPSPAGVCAKTGGDEEKVVAWVCIYWFAG